MFDYEDDFYSEGDDDLDDFDYYVSYIKALEEDHISNSNIVRELMDEFDLEKDEAVKVLKRYLREKSDEDDEDEYDENSDGVDEDYGDGNTEN